MIFIDTGAFLARYLANDQHHKPATALWEKIQAARERCNVTTNFVHDEAFTLLGRRASYSFAAQKARLIYASSALQILRPDGLAELAALNLFEKFADQEDSALSIAVRAPSCARQEWKSGILFRLTF